MNKKGKLSQKASIGLVLIFLGIAILISYPNQAYWTASSLLSIAIGVYLVSRE